MTEEDLSPRIQTTKKISEGFKENSSTLILQPEALAEVFQQPRPQVMEAVKENEFEDLQAVTEYGKENIEDFHPNDVKKLFQNGVIGHPTSDGGCEEGIITHRDQPIEIEPDLILSVPYDEATGHFNKGYNGILVRYLDKALEKLSDLEHQQWQSWINYCISNYNLPDKLVQKWKSNDRPYEELSEEEKEKDRKWARKSLEALQKGEHE